MARKHGARFLLLVLLSGAATPVLAEEDCEAYCRGFADGFCSAQGKTAEYQGCESGSGGTPNCYFGCAPKIAG